MEPLHIAICDDLPQEQETLLSMLAQSPLQTSCTLFRSGEELLEAFQPGAFDLLLVDIYMEGITGVEAVRRIREADKDVPVAFTTTSTDHTLESYRLSALKYLEKPVRQKDLNDLLRMVKLQKDDAPALTIRQDGAPRRIALSDLVCLEQRAHHVLLFLRHGERVQIYGKLSALLPRLEGQPFFCPHKSFCVHLRFVRAINAEYQCYVMTDGRNVPISRPNRSRAKKAYEDFLFSRTRGEEGAWGKSPCE